MLCPVTALFNIAWRMGKAGEPNSRDDHIGKGISHLLHNRLNAPAATKDTTNFLHLPICVSNIRSGAPSPLLAKGHLNPSLHLLTIK